MYQIKNFWSVKIFILKTNSDLYCLKIFEKKSKINLEKNCVIMAETLSDFREN